MSYPRGLNRSQSNLVDWISSMDTLWRPCLTLFCPGPTHTHHAEDNKTTVWTDGLWDPIRSAMGLTLRMLIMIQVGCESEVEKQDQVGSFMRNEGQIEMGDTEHTVEQKQIPSITK